MKKTLLFISFAFSNFLNAQIVVVTNPSSPWTVPSGVTSVTVECWGGGGGGAGSLGNPGSGTTGGNGGGGGAYSKQVLTVIAAQLYTVTIGTGGAGGAAGNIAGINGGTSTFTGTGGTCSAAGGAGGANNGSVSAIAAGGASGVGFLYAGGAGGWGGYNGSYDFGGGGGGGAGNASAGIAGTGYPSTSGTGGAGGTGSPNAAPYIGGTGGTSASTATGATPSGGGSGGETGFPPVVGNAGGAGQVLLTYNACTPPTITGTTPASRCGIGTVTLGATSSAGVVNWYANLTGGSSLGTGTTFTTPSISTTTTYYAEGYVTTGCVSASRTAVIATVNPTPTVTVNAATICSGASAMLTATGASTYLWNTAATTNTISVSPATTTVYTVTGTTSGCTNAVTTTVTVNPVPVVSSVSVTPATCGNNNGSANATVTGGGSPYTYQWSSGEAQALADSLFSGQYQLTVSNQFGCITSTVITVPSSNGPVVTLSNSTNVKCAGGSTGSLTVTVTGGAVPYTYAWTNGATTSTVNNLIAGTYIVTVTDNAGCKITGSYLVTQPAPISIQFSVTPSVCAGSTGSAAAVVSGGTGSYTYQWSANAASQTTSTASGLAAGLYSVVVTDILGCTKNASVMVSTNIAGATIVLDSIKAGNCGNNGQSGIYITTSGGLFPYSWNWSNGASTEDISGIAPGTYSLGVVDANGCMTFATYTVLNSSPNYQPEICLVTVDTTSPITSNLIAWEKTGAIGIKQYNIYCEIGSYNNYQLVGTVSGGSLSEYIHVGANPNVKSWKYKISAVDSCGIESSLSSYHKTIHLQISAGVGGIMNLSWDNYYGFNYGGFEVWRFHPTTNWVQLTSIAYCGFVICQNSYTDLSPIVGDTNRYAVLVVPPTPCVTTARLANTNGISTTIIKAKSNITNNRMSGVGVQQWASGSMQVAVYPNPSNGTFVLETNSIAKQIVSIFDLTGKIVLLQTITGTTTIDTRKLNEGIYTINIFGNEGVVNKKLVIVR